MNPGLEAKVVAALTAGITVGGTTYHSFAEICLALDAGTLTIEGVVEILNIALPGNSNPTEIAATVACLSPLFTTTSTG